MREIKFRAWDKFNDCYWYSANFSTLADFFVAMQECISNGNELAFEQYASLKDRNGKEIYEGDIVSMPYSRCTQNWQVLEMSAYGQRFLRLTAKPHPAPHYFRGLHHFDKCEVIGNIYENPELLSDGPKTAQEITNPDNSEKPLSKTGGEKRSDYLGHGKAPNNARKPSKSAT